MATLICLATGSYCSMFAVGCGHGNDVPCVVSRLAWAPWLGAEIPRAAREDKPCSANTFQVFLLSHLLLSHGQNKSRGLAQSQYRRDFPEACVQEGMKKLGPLLQKPSTWDRHVIYQTCFPEVKNIKSQAIMKGLANYGLQAKSCLLPVYISKILLKHGHTHLFIYYLWMLSYHNGRYKSLYALTI